MEFAELPDNIFLQIFKELPFKDRVRAGRVDHSFRRMSRIAISVTKCLRLKNSIFRKLTPDSLKILLDLCAKNLEKLTVPPKTVETFAQFQCPRVVELYVH